MKNLIPFKSFFEAYHSKDVYDRKREYAANQMLKNKSIDTLTESQHDILSRLCTLRHDYTYKY